MEFTNDKGVDIILDINGFLKEKNILSSLSRKPRNTHSQPCLQPLPRFLICKAPPFSHLKRCVVTLIGRKDKVAEVKHQNRFLS